MVLLLPANPPKTSARAPCQRLSLACLSVVGLQPALEQSEEAYTNERQNERPQGNRHKGHRPMACGRCGSFTPGAFQQPPERFADRILSYHPAIHSIGGAGDKRSLTLRNPIDVVCVRR